MKIKFSFTKTKAPNLINMCNLKDLGLWKPNYIPHIFLIYFELQRDIHKEIIRNKNQAWIKKDWYLFLTLDFAGGFSSSSVPLSESTCLWWISMVPAISPGNSMFPAYPISSSLTSPDAYLPGGGGSKTKSRSWEWLLDSNAAIASLRVPNALFSCYLYIYFYCLIILKYRKYVLHIGWCSHLETFRFSLNIWIVNCLAWKVYLC